MSVEHATRNANWENSERRERFQQWGNTTNSWRQRGRGFPRAGGILTPMNGRVESADGKLTQMWMRMTEVGVKSGVTLMAGETNLRGSEKCFCTHGRESWS